MVVADASVWISSLLSGDVNHVVSRQWIRRWTRAGGAIVVPTLFLAEVAGAMARQTGQTRLGLRAVTDILASPRIRLDALDRTLAEAAARHAASLPLKGADAVYVALAEQLGVPLVTWDREQLTRAASVIAVQTPAI
jgi:predicted nucleic acid-binding protein